MRLSAAQAGVISSCGTQPPAEEADEAPNDDDRGDGDARDRAGREAAPVRAGGCACVCLAVEGVAVPARSACSSGSST